MVQREFAECEPFPARVKLGACGPRDDDRPPPALLARPLRPDEERFDAAFPRRRPDDGARGRGPPGGGPRAPAPRREPRGRDRRGAAAGRARAPALRARCGRRPLGVHSPLRRRLLARRADSAPPRDAAVEDGDGHACPPQGRLRAADPGEGGAPAGSEAPGPRLRATRQPAPAARPRELRRSLPPPSSRDRASSPARRRPSSASRASGTSSACTESPRPRRPRASSVSAASVPGRRGSSASTGSAASSRGSSATWA